MNLPSLSVANSCSVGVIESRIFVSKIITMTSVWAISCMHPLLLKERKIENNTGKYVETLVTHVITYENILHACPILDSRSAHPMRWQPLQREVE